MLDVLKLIVVIGLLMGLVGMLIALCAFDWHALLALSASTYVFNKVGDELVDNKTTKETVQCN